MLLANTNPATAEAYRDALGLRGVALPLKPGDDVEIVLDARGRVFAQIDPDGTMDDATVAALRRALILAVNVCGGLSYRKA